MEAARISAKNEFESYTYQLRNALGEMKGKQPESPQTMDTQEGEGSNTGSTSCTALTLQERTSVRAHAPSLQIITSIDAEAIPGALVEDALDSQYHGRLFRVDH